MWASNRLTVGFFLLFLTWVIASNNKFSIINNWLKETTLDEIWLWDNNKYLTSVTSNTFNVSETDQANEKQMKSVLKSSLGSFDW